jgi:hypothetical protein
MLELDFSKRITAQEALNHPFFDSLRGVDEGPEHDMVDLTSIGLA